jgi:hypothetical protein
MEGRAVKPAILTDAEREEILATRMKQIQDQIEFLDLEYTRLYIEWHRLWVKKDIRKIEEWQNA